MLKGSGLLASRKCLPAPPPAAAGHCLPMSHVCAEGEEERGAGGQGWQACGADQPHPQPSALRHRRPRPAPRPALQVGAGRWLGGEVDGLKGAGTARLGTAPASGSATHSACTAAAAGRTCRALGWPTARPRSSTCSGSRWGDGSGRMGGTLVTKQLGGISGPEFSGIVGQLFLCLWCCCCPLCRRQSFTSPPSLPRRRSEAAAAAGGGRAAGQHEWPAAQRPMPAQPQVVLHTIRRTGHYTAAKPGRCRLPARG